MTQYIIIRIVSPSSKLKKYCTLQTSTICKRGLTEEEPEVKIQIIDKRRSCYILVLVTTHGQLFAINAKTLFTRLTLMTMKK